MRLSLVILTAISVFSMTSAQAGVMEDIRGMQAGNPKFSKMEKAKIEKVAHRVTRKQDAEGEDDVLNFAPQNDTEDNNDADIRWRRERYEAWQRAQDNDNAGWALPQDEARDDAPQNYRQEASYHDELDDGWVDSDAGTQPLARQEIVYASKEKPGTIIIDTKARHLFFILGDGRAMQYGIGVGRPGFEWAGIKSITRKAEWPDWRPPEQMIRRRPDLPRFMPGGPSNPLGARAMYLGSTIYRIHGSNEPETIGQAVSSGCIRMINRDVVDLYERVKVGTKVVVLR